MADRKKREIQRCEYLENEKNFLDEIMKNNTQAFKI